MPALRTITGKLVTQDGIAIANAEIILLDDTGSVVGRCDTNSEGTFTAAIETAADEIALTVDDTTVATSSWGGDSSTGIDFGAVIAGRLPSPGEWHVMGVITNALTGEPLGEVTVELFDVDSQGDQGPFYDPLGEDVTSDDGQYDIWFDKSAFARSIGSHAEPFMPDLFFRVRHRTGVVLYESESVLASTVGRNHTCRHTGYEDHSGVEVDIAVDHVTVTLAKIGPVPIADIDEDGSATYDEITGRPFTSEITLEGTIGGANLQTWAIFYAEGFIDSSDSRLGQLSTSNPPEGFELIASGSAQDSIDDDPIVTWNTANLEGLYTLVVAAWDNDYKVFYTIYRVLLHNAEDQPKAVISHPDGKEDVSKADYADGVVTITGTASSPYFSHFVLLRSGPDTKTDGGGEGYVSLAPTSLNPETNEGTTEGALATWDISALTIERSTGDNHRLRLRVFDKTVSDATLNQISREAVFEQSFYVTE